MNVFYLCDNPFEAAEVMCDQHVVKMPLECAQLLSTAHHILGDSGPYACTHVNHPSAVWVRESTLQYQWVLEHMLGLLWEYTKRFDKLHGCESVWDKLDCYPELMKCRDFKEPPQCMPDECKVDGNTALAYRNYYHYKAKQWWDSGRPMRYHRMSLTPKEVQEIV